MAEGQKQLAQYSEGLHALSIGTQVLALELPGKWQKQAKQVLSLAERAFEKEVEGKETRARAGMEAKLALPSA